MTRTVFLNFFYGLLYHLTKKQPPLSIGQVIGVVFMFFYIIEPKMEGLFGLFLFTKQISATITMQKSNLIMTTRNDSFLMPL